MTDKPDSRRSSTAGVDSHRSSTGHVAVDQCSIYVCILCDDDGFNPEVESKFRDASERLRCWISESDLEPGPVEVGIVVIGPSVVTYAHIASIWLDSEAWESLEKALGDHKFVLCLQSYLLGSRGKPAILEDGFLEAWQMSRMVKRAGLQGLVIPQEETPGLPS